jgi:hypothetical protein
VWIALSDVAMAQVMSACRPLSTVDRTRFLELLAERPNGRREVGDGEVYCIVRELQRESLRLCAQAELAAVFNSQRFLTECPARTAHRAFVPESISAWPCGP